jgi:hypothetical protein
MTTASIAARLRGPDGWLLAASLLAYLAAMPLDAFCTPGTCSEWPSYSLLFLGWIELYIFPRAGYVWLANPALMMAWWYIFRGRKLAAVALSLTGLVLSASFLAVPKVMIAELEPPAPLLGFGLGYWLWLASAGTALLAALLMRTGAGAQPTADPTT